MYTYEDRMRAVALYIKLGGATSQVVWILIFASTSAVLGYVLAGYGPLQLGAKSSVSAAGTIAVVSGIILGTITLIGPKRRAVL